MAALAALGAIAGIAGTMGGITTGYNRSSTSTLTPAQQLNSYRMLSAMNPYMGSHFETLNQLGQSPVNAYNQIPSYQQDYSNKIAAPSMQRQRQMVNSIGDPAHGRSRTASRQRFTTEARMSNNQLRNALMKQDLGMQTTGQSDMLNRQLGALGTMTDAWNMPMGRSRENYQIQSSLGSNIVGGLQGLTNVVNMGKNLYDSYILNNPSSGFSTNPNGTFNISGSGSGNWVQG